MAASKTATGRKKSTPLIASKSFCEFFAGIGLVREGLAASGWSCVYANDIDPKKEEMYAKRFGTDGHFHLGDIWNTDEAVARIEQRPFLATASFPCIDLSLAGHWRGFDGEHSSTFFGFVKLLQALDDRRPKVVMLENVTGFITSQDGKDFESAVQALADLGYWIDALVLDAKYFVPQSRPRVFVIGVADDVNSKFFAKKTNGGWFGEKWMEFIERGGVLRPAKLRSLRETIALSTGWGAFDIKPPVAKRRQLVDLIDMDDEQEWWDEAAVTKHHNMMSDLHRGEVDEMLANGSTHIGTIYRRKRKGKTRAETRFDGVAGCLRTPKGGSARQIVIIVSEGRLRMRWMSPREYARLQGADDFPLVGNTIQNLYGFGDAVCVPAIRWLDQQILTPLFEAETGPKRN